MSERITCKIEHGGTWTWFVDLHVDGEYVESSVHWSRLAAAVRAWRIRRLVGQS